MESKILFGSDARQAMFEGIRELSDAVTTTLGPLGHTVILNRGYHYPHVTKDGVTVANAYATESVEKGLGAMLIQQAASKTCDEAGDGTTTTVLLARKMIEYGIDVLGSDRKVSAREFRRGMQDALQIALDKLNGLTNKVGEKDFDTIRRIALVSANGDEEVAEMIVEAIQNVGKDGVITVEESPNRSEMSVEVTTGFHWNKGLTSHYFATNLERMECVLERPLILVLSQRVNSFQEIVAMVQTAYTEKRPLLIVAPDMSNDAMKFLILNIQKGVLQGAFVKAPGYGQVQTDLTEDFACRVGATVVETGDNASPMSLGSCTRVVISKNETVIVGGEGAEDAVAQRVNSIKYQLENESNTYDKEKLRERIAYLTGGTAVLSVGGNSEVELKERKDRIDDAVSAVKSALEEGYVAGCGVCAAQLATEISRTTYDDPMSDYIKGKDCVLRALYWVNITVLRNAGIDTADDLSDPNKKGRDLDAFWLNYDNTDHVRYSETGEPIQEFSRSIDPVTGKEIDVFEKGIIDPTKVVRCALTNAVSVAIQFLNTDCLLATPVEQK